MLKTTSIFIPLIYIHFNPVFTGRSLQKIPDQLIGRLEEGRTNQLLQFLHRHPGEFLRFESVDQLLDFLLLGEDDLRRDIAFFFEPEA